MAIPLTGPISLSMIQAEFGGPMPARLSDYYRGGLYVPDTPENASVPTSGPISMSNFYGASAAPPVSPPVWVTPTVIGSFEALKPYDFQFNAYDPDGGTVTYTKTGGLSDATLTSSGRLQGVAPNVSVETSSGFEVTATSSSGAYTPKTFNIRFYPAQAEWFTPALTLDITQNPTTPSNIYFYFTDPNNNSHIEQTPGNPLPSGTALYDEVPEGTPSNLKGVTLRGYLTAGTHYVNLDLVRPTGRVPRTFTLNVTVESGSGGGTGGGGGNEGGGEIVHN